jgi:uncharacterized protein YlxP (DUF503 family)
MPGRDNYSGIYKAKYDLDDLRQEIGAWTIYSDRVNQERSLNKILNLIESIFSTLIESVDELR